MCFRCWKPWKVNLWVNTKKAKREKNKQTNIHVEFSVSVCFGGLLIPNHYINLNSPSFSFCITIMDWGYYLWHPVKKPWSKEMLPADGAAAMRGADTLRCGKINPNLTVIHCMNHHDAVKHATEATTHFFLHIFHSTYWLSGLVIYSFFFFFIYNGPRVISRYMERRSYMPMMEAPTQREQEKLSRPSSKYLDLQTDCSSNIYFYLFGWQHAASLHFQMISCKLLKFARLTIWCYVRERDLFLTVRLYCLVWLLNLCL